MTFILALGVVWLLFIVVAIVAETGRLDPLLDWLDR